MPESCTFDADKLLVRLDLTFKADVNAVSPIVDSVLETAGRMGCGRGHEMEIEIALREALTNAIKHGCAGDASKEVRCCIACDESRGMLIIVSDPGRGFDPATVPSPLLGEQLYSDHGRGLVPYQPTDGPGLVSDRGTQIHMVKSASEAGTPNSGSRGVLSTFWKLTETIEGGRMGPTHRAWRVTLSAQTAARSCHPICRHPVPTLWAVNCRALSQRRRRRMPKGDFSS